MRVERETLLQLRDQVEDEVGGRSMLLERFLAFHRENPDVFDLLLEYSVRVERRGRRHYGIGMIYERVRWQVDIETREDTGLKLNNNYRAYYARLLMLVRPSLRHVFTTRALGPHREAQIV